MVTNNFVVHMSGNVRQEFGYSNQESPDNIKAVQTSFSSVDLTTEKCSDYRRKIRSQEDVRNNQTDEQLQNEILEWLRVTYSNKSNKLLGEKMQRLAQKLNRPGGEEKIRQKIVKYLKRVPSNLSDCDEDRREFREQLPNNIIRKLKQMYLKPEKKRSYQSSPVRVFRIEVPKYETNYNENTLKSSVDNWLKDVPMKKRDFLGRSIKKEDVLKAVVNQIHPYILNRHNFDKDHRATLNHAILEILKEIPIEIGEYDKTPYLNKLAITLMNDLFNMNNDDYSFYEVTQTNQRNSIENRNSQHVNIEVFVANEITNIMKKLHLSISTNRLALLEEELNDTLLEVIITNDDINAYKEIIFIILHNLGGLSNYQANYFTDIIIKHFKEECCDDRINKKKQGNLFRSNSLTGVSQNDTYSVFHNICKNKSNIINHDTGGNKTATNDHDDESTYKFHLIEEIEQWLHKLNIQIPFKTGTKERAIQDLAEDIIDRFKYLELNPSNKGTDENELQYLKYQIFKWINKIAGENTMKTIEHAHELMERIQTVNATRHNNNDTLFHQLKEVIYEFLKDVNDINNIADQIKDLVLNLVKGIKSMNTVNTVIDKEVDAWSKIVLKGKKTPRPIKILKEKLKNIFANKYSNTDPKKEKVCIRKYEDLIDDWLDSILILICGEIPRLGNRNEYIHNLATKLYKILFNEFPADGSYDLESIFLEWLEDLQLPFAEDKQNVIKGHVNKLVESLLNARKEIQSNQSKSKDDDTSTSQRVTAKPHHKNTNVAKNNINKEIKMASSNITVYEVTLPNNTDTRIKEINENDIEASLQQYSKQLVQQIHEWLSSLQVQQIHDKGFREIVVNDLAGDIIDRHKYLELNPASRGTEEHELEQLKYQIFKWINKLVGEDEEETVQRASELMDRIRSIPVPMLVKQSERESNACCPSPGNEYACKNKTMSNKVYPNSSGNKGNVSTNVNKSSTNRSVSDRVTSPSNVRLSSPLGFTTGPMSTSTQNGGQKRAVSPDKVINGNNKRNCPVVCAAKVSEESRELPPGMKLNDVYAHYDIIINDRIKEIPLDTPTPEQEMLADLAKKGLHNGIWKTYFQLKADPEIENDYSYFELAFEGQIDNMLDCLPQTEEMQKIRAGWKSRLLFDVMNMLKHVHSITDTPSFRQNIEEKFDRQFLKAHYQESSDLHQHGFVVRTADAYILFSKYKEEDPIKANIYRQRLMKRIEELADAVKSQNNVNFRYINQAQLCQVAMQLLESVPIPKDEALKNEADEILVGEEIENWYNALPVKPIINETEDIIRKRLRELLAKKLCEIEKRADNDDSRIEMDAKHEISKFLHEKAALQPNEDLNINIMVEELTNRLKYRRDQNMVGYETFEGEKPISSSFVQTDPGEVLAPLVDLGVEDQRHSILREESTRTNARHDPQNQGGLHTSQVGSCSRAYYPGKESILGTSQVQPSQGFPSERISLNESRRQSNAADRIMPNCCHRPSHETENMNGVNRSFVPEMVPYAQNQCHVGQGTGQGMPIGTMVSSQPQKIGQGINRTCISNGQRQSIQIGTAGPSQPQTLGQAERSTARQQSQPMPNGQVFGQGYLSVPQGTTGYVSDPDTRSTARVGSPGTPDDDEGVDEVRVRCRCMERVWKYKRHRFEDRPCYPMPFPCRYYY